MRDRFLVGKGIVGGSRRLKRIVDGLLDIAPLRTKPKVIRQFAQVRNRICAIEILEHFVNLFVKSRTIGSADRFVNRRANKRVSERVPPA
jgi:hypothetical protein